MCDSFENDLCTGTITLDESRNYLHISCSLKENPMNNEVMFISASPVEKRASFSGSGLPFANYAQAFEGRF